MGFAASLSSLWGLNDTMPRKGGRCGARAGDQEYGRYFAIKDRQRCAPAPFRRGDVDVESKVRIQM
jgi:hypothetical protein